MKYLKEIFQLFVDCRKLQMNWEDVCNIISNDSKYSNLQFSGDQVHVMSVTPTPYGAGYRSTPVPAGTPQPSFVCLLSPPDTGSQILNAVQTGRHVLRFPNGDTLSLPSTSTFTYNGNSTRAVNLPYDGKSQGVFFCEASNSRQTTRVPVAILVYYSKL